MKLASGPSSLHLQKVDISVQNYEIKNSGDDGGMFSKVRNKSIMGL
jgi:hypothetical protein